MKTLFKYVVAFLFAGFFFHLPVHAEPKFNAKQAYVVNLDTGEVIIDKRPTDVASIASITKLMTALIIATSTLDMSEEITITKADLKATRHSHRTVGLFVGAKYTREELLLIALMSSSNRAAAALARTHPDGYDNFVELMNQKAFELGMYNSRFMDPAGLFFGNISTPEDLIKLLKAAIDHPMIGRFSTETYYKKEHKITTKVKRRVRNKKTKKYYTRWIKTDREVTRYYGTTNRLLLTDDWDIFLQKTGYIKAAGRCMVMVLNINGERYGMVFLHASNQRSRALDVIKAKYWIEYHVELSRKTLAKLDPFRRVRYGK